MTLAGAVTVVGSTISFGNTVTGGHTLTVNADDGGTVTLGGAVTLTNDGVLMVTATNGMIDLEAASYSSANGNISLDGAVRLHTDVSVTSSGGSITFGGTVSALANGAQSLTLNASNGNIMFGGNVGSITSKLATMTIANARDVTSAGSIYVESFEQLAGTGTTDFGLSTIYADTSVNVRTRNINGKIVARGLRR